MHFWHLLTTFKLSLPSSRSCVVASAVSNRPAFARNHFQPFLFISPRQVYQAARIVSISCASVSTAPYNHLRSLPSLAMGSLITLVSSLQKGAIKFDAIPWELISVLSMWAFNSVAERWPSILVDFTVIHGQNQRPVTEHGSHGSTASTATFSSNALFLRFGSCLSLLQR